MRTCKILLALIVIGSIFLASCGGTQGEAKKISIAWTQEPNSLNRTYSSMWYMAALIQIYSCSPWQYDENNEPYPYMLTEMPSVSDDGLVVTMHLRDDLVWSDGTPITSEDFIFTHAMITDPGNLVDSVYPGSKYWSALFCSFFNRSAHSEMVQ